MIYVSQLLCHFQTVASLEKLLTECRMENTQGGAGGRNKSSEATETRLYCILGHLHLLLQNYPKGS